MRLYLQQLLRTNFNQYNDLATLKQKRKRKKKDDFASISKGHQGIASPLGDITGCLCDFPSSGTLSLVCTSSSGALPLGWTLLCLLTHSQTIVLKEG